MRFPSIDEVIDYANFYYYSEPMSVFNIKTLEIPFPISLTEINHGVYQFLIRVSHGPLHVISAMELINKIHKTYKIHVKAYEDSFNAVADSFKISPADLLRLIEIAVIFHDSGRKGDGLDLWDEDSAEALYRYLIDECQIEEKLAIFIADTVRYKDDIESFKKKYSNQAGYICELVNMADALEVIRTRDLFKPKFLPINKHVSAEQMIENIIPNLVVPHRNEIIEQGRLSKEGRIEYKVNGQHYDDSAYVPTSGKDFAKIAKTYKEKCEMHSLSVLDITQDNLSQVFDRASRGIEMYKGEYKESGIQLFHNGFFSPRYHGDRGLNRARYYANQLSLGQSTQTKVNALCALFTSQDGKTLKEAVLRSFNQTNHALILTQLNRIAAELNENNHHEKAIQDYVIEADGFAIQSI